MNMHVEAGSTREPEIILRRTFDVPREKLWVAFTDPKHVARWYGGHGFTSPVCEMDVRPGGRWHHVMRTPDGHEFATDFVFVEVVRPERLVWEHANHRRRPANHPPTCRMTVTFEDAGGKTVLTTTARFDTVADRDAAMQIGFAEIIAQGSEKLDAIARALVSGA